MVFVVKFTTEVSAFLYIVYLDSCPSMNIRTNGITVDDNNDTCPDETIIYGSRLAVILLLGRCYCHAVLSVRKDSSVTKEVRVLVTLWASEVRTRYLHLVYDFKYRKQ